MISLYRAALDLQQVLQQQRWSFSFIGGLALQRCGEPRLTRDIDLTLFTGFGTEPFFIDVLCGLYRLRLQDGRDFAIHNRVLLLMTQDGIGIDFALAGLPYEQRLIDRSSHFSFLPDCSLQTCSAEDLIITKAFADRDQDWIDIRGILIRCQGRLDWPLIEQELKPLVAAKEKPEIISRLLLERDIYA